jgi:4-amino-4-deoxychorismate lyase
MTSSRILINPSHISATDRSIQYGDACFTSMYVENGKILLLPAHIARLQEACTRLAIAFSDWLLLQTELAKLAHELTGPSVIKILISRGSGGRGYRPPVLVQPLCIISSHLALPILPVPKVESLGVSSIELHKEHWSGGIKHNNRLAQVLARDSEITKTRSTHSHVDAGEDLILEYEEVLMCNQHGHVVEASSANVFYNIDGVWYTPPMHDYGVKGVMRNAWMLHLQQRGINVNETYHHLDLLVHAQSVLLSNAVRGVRPVAELHLRGKVYSYNTVSEKDTIAEFIRGAMQSS